MKQILKTLLVSAMLPLAIEAADAISTNTPVGMVRGSLADSAKFETLNPRFAKAFAFLRSHDLATLSPGRHTIDGDNIYANVTDVKLKTWNPQAKLEVHRQYIDIQVPVSGPETFGYFYDEKGAQARMPGFDPKGDYILFTNPAMRKTVVAPGGFIVFFPYHGPHAPGMTEGDPKTIRKIVVKVAL